MPGQANQAVRLAVTSRLKYAPLQQLLVHRTDIHALEDLGPPGFRQHVVGVGGVQGIAHAVFHRLAKAQSINRARPVLIDLGDGRLPARKAAFAESLDDLAQSHHVRPATHADTPVRRSWRCHSTSR